MFLLIACVNRKQWTPAILYRESRHGVLASA